MYEVKLNLPRNALYCRATGMFGPEEARRYVSSFTKALDQLSPGFTVITDMRESQPATLDVRTIVDEMISHCERVGIGCAVRIVSEELSCQLGNLQLSQKTRGRYPVHVVKSNDEVEELTGWSLHSFV